MPDQRELFDRWQTKANHAGLHFIEDGVIDENRWSSAPTKVLFLLKEAYGGINNLTDHIQKNCSLKKGTWKRCACWAHVALTKTPRKFEDIVNDEPSLRKALFSCSVVNIKKSDGKSESDMEEIKRYAEQDSELLQEQISMIRPDLIISGGVFDSLHLIWKDMPIEKKGRRVWLIDNRITAINFCHPACFYPDDFMYWSMMQVINEARDLKLLAYPES